MTFDERLHPRALRGRFTEKTHTEPEITMTDTVTCANCHLRRARGVVHRCPAPGLLTLSDATRKVLAACRAAGGRPLIVGGSVRDALISRANATSPKDVDIEVYGVTGYEPLQKRLTRLGRVDLTGVSFGVLKCTVDGEDFDVSLPRTDSKTGDGHRGFTTTANAALNEVDAAARRDFTINAIGWDDQIEELVDPWGGTADIRDRTLRHVGPAFVEDPLRVLRAVQLSARFGYDLAPETAELAQSIAHTYTELARERVWGEWQKLATRGTYISAAIRTLEASGWLEHFPALADCRGCEQEPEWHPEGDVLTHQGLAADIAAARNADLTDEERQTAVLGALLHDVGKPAVTVIIDGKLRSHGHDDAGEPIARDFLAQIGAPHAVADKVGPIVYEHMCHTSAGNGTPSASSVRRLIRRLDRGPGSPTLEDWARVVDADCGGRGTGAKESPTAAWLAVARELGDITKPRKSLLRGDHLIAAGWTPGPSFKHVIAAAVAAQDDGEFDDEAGALRWFETHGSLHVGGVLLR